MPRRAKGTRLWFDDALGRWYIRDGQKKRGTGCGADERERAERALERYIAEKYEPPRTGRPAGVLVDDILTFYAREVAPRHRAKRNTAYVIEKLLTFWSGRPILDIRRSTCREYVEFRTAQPRPQAKTEAARKQRITVETARRELAILRAALNAYHAEHTLDALPVVTLPEAAPPKPRWLTRTEAARLLRAAWRMEDRDAARGLCRFILIGLYTGTRAGAIRTLGWTPNVRGGWIDLAAGVMHRRGADAETKKRKPPVRLPPALLAFMRRWREKDGGTAWVIHYRGVPVDAQRRAWDRARVSAGLGKDVTPHVLRHTAATWLLRSGASTADTADFLGMSEQVLREVYGHNHPDFQRDVAARAGKGGRVPV